MSPPARRLVGVWDVMLRLERPVQLVMTPPIGELPGTIAFIENSAGRVSLPDFPGAMNYGAYAIDFRSFGFDPSDGGKVPTALARTHGDSVALVLTTGSDDPSIFMRGRFDGDSVTGSWTVVSRTTGGGGRFVMRRRA